MDVEVNLAAVLLASVAMLVVGAVWFTPLFGKLWEKIHGFDKLNKKEKAQAQKDMMPLMAIQFAMNLVSAYVLAHLLAAMPDESPYKLAFWLWFGFVFTAEVSAVIFSDTPKKWMSKKIAVMVGGSLAWFMVSAWVITNVS
jgi:hypothetical protein